MKPEASKLYNYTGFNPFTDSQGRNFTDSKISKEFFPISKFWSLFNDHHEILIGTRGSGKTFLLKMMRRSMLMDMEHDDAKRIINEKIYYPFYVPMHMETIAALNDCRIDEEKKIILFKFIFNSLLAESVIEELIKHLEKFEKKEAIELSFNIASKLNEIWFPAESNSCLIDLYDLQVKVRQKSYNFDYLNDDIKNISVMFRRDFAGPLIGGAQIILERAFDIKKDSMWIICIDEAEFIPVLFQKCINSFMRSNTNRIALKVATLPYYWKTLETLDENINISAEHDVYYQILDMHFESEDFISLTNKLCKHRLNSITTIDINVDKLEDFLGKIGNDNRIDYFKDIVGDEKAASEQVISDIINSFSDKRKEGATSYKNVEKTIHQKFAPVYYTREVYRKMHTRGQGHLIPGWYAGADIVRKVSQGNPRLFIRLMSSLFTKATESTFSTKVQHQVVSKFAEEFCNASQAIEVDGHLVYEKLEKTGDFVSRKVHGKDLISVGNSFKYKYNSEEEFEEWKVWLQRAIAFSKLSVSENAIIAGLSQDTIYTFSNAYAVKYWIPMRNDSPTIVPTTFTKKEENGQVSLFDYCHGKI